MKIEQENISVEVDTNYKDNRYVKIKKDQKEIEVNMSEFRKLLAMMTAIQQMLVRD